MIKPESTKATKMRRELRLLAFLDEIKKEDNWGNWLNKKNELHVSKVCRYLSEETGEISWDSTFFRGTGWGVRYKEDFNKWVIRKMATAQENEINIARDIYELDLPEWIKTEKMPEKVLEFILNQKKDHELEIKRNMMLVRKISTLEQRTIELQSQIDYLTKKWRLFDEHYMISIRTLKYD